MNAKDEGASERPYDPRFDLTVDEACTKKLIAVIEEAKRLADSRPLVAIKICLDMQQVLRGIEQEAAVRANGRFRISWRKIDRALGKKQHWAWDRYVAYGLSHPKTRRRSAKLTPPEMEEEPEG